MGSHCDARCAHCYSQAQRARAGQALTELELERIIEQLVALGVRSVNLGGNEPIFTHGPSLEHSRLPWLLRRSSRAGIAVGLTTNGTSILHLLDHHPSALATLNDIDFSLDFPCRSSHDRHRGAPLFATVVEGIRRCREAGIPCAIATCATRESFTVAHIDGFMDLAWLLDCELRVNILQPVHRGLIALMPSRDAFYRGFARLMAHTDCITLGDSCLAALTQRPTQGCPCGDSSLRVLSQTGDGRVPISPCVYAHDFSGGDLLTEQLAIITQREPFASFERRRLRLPRACREADCPWLERCRGGCSSRTWLVHGDLEAKDPYCPLDYKAEHGQPPPLPPLEAPTTQPALRVHDGYLCTWIGRVRERYQPRRECLEDFLEG